MLRVTHDFEKVRVSPEGCPFYAVHRSCQPGISQRTTFKVLRWKMAMQEYNFRLFHIPGEKNVVADGFSRLTEETPSAPSILLNVIEEPNHSVDSELIRASEENALDVRASPLADIASRGILRSSEHQNNVLVMKQRGIPNEPCIAI